jgi:hypothetical protein
MWKVDRGSQIGITTDNYTDALSWNVSEMGKKTILLKNIDTINNLRYRMDGYVSFGGIVNELVPVNQLAPNEIAEFHYEHQWGKLVLQVKTAVIGNPANYRVDYEGQGA